MLISQKANPRNPRTQSDIVSDEIAQVMAEETGRFRSTPHSSIGGIPTEYADHMTHIRKAHLRDPERLREAVDDDAFYGPVGFGGLRATQGLPKRS